VRKKFIRIAVLFGLALFAFLVYRTGPAEILRQIRRLTWSNFFILVALRLGYWTLRTICWRLAFAAYDGPISFFSMLKARLASYAVGYITPSAMLGGEPLRALMVKGRSRRRNMATVVIDKTFEILTMSFFTVAAVLIALTRLPMPESYRMIFVVFIGVILLLVLFLLVRQRKGMFIGIIDTMARIGLRFKFIERNRSHIQDIDAHVSDFYGRHRGRIPVLALHNVLAIAFWVGEIYLTLRLLHAPGATVFKSFLVITLSNVALLLPTIPGAVGVYEVASVGVFALLGWNASLAMSMAIVRRIVTLVWVGIGLLAAWTSHVSIKDL
jgi:uncharacterized protein (TIRG00374 family)